VKGFSETGNTGNAGKFELPRTRVKYLIRLKKNLAGESRSAICALPRFCGGVRCAAYRKNARQFSLFCVLAGSAAASEIAVVPIKSTFLALRSVP